MEEQILVVGYFGHNNLGDDAFKWIFENIFSSFTSFKITCVDADKLQLPLSPSIRAVIVGGGDLINDYFMKKLKPLLEERKFRTCPIYAIGIGIPYEKLIAAGYLDGFDYIIHRSPEDQQFLLSRFGEAQVHFAPDLAWLMYNNHHLKNSHLQEEENLNFAQRKIAVCLARPMFNERSPECYKKIVDGLAVFFCSLVMEKTQSNKRRFCWSRKHDNNLELSPPKYILEFLPFSTGKVKEQNDCVINQDVYNRMLELSGVESFSNVVLHESPPLPENVLTTFRNFDFVICSRFHAHIFALMSRVPFLSINSTRKVHTLVKHANLQDYEYSLPIDPEFMHPIDCDPKELFSKFSALLTNELQVRKIITAYFKDSLGEIRKLKKRLKNLFFYLPAPRTNFIKLNVARKAAEFLLQSAKQVRVILDGPETIIENVLCSSVDDAAISRTCVSPANENEVALILSPGGLKKWGLSQDDAGRLVAFLSYLLTGTPNSEYAWGMQQQILEDSFHLPEACKWIFDHRLRESTQHRIQSLPAWKAENEVARKHRSINVEFIREFADYQGKHRSGWDYVMQKVRKLHNPQSSLIFDGYLDETFGWRYDTLVDVGRIPFTQSWAGILHHTPEQQFSEHNLVRLFERSAWRASLPFCKFLITLSAALANWVQDQLTALGFPNIPVHVIKHPTEGVSETNLNSTIQGFDLNFFLKQSRRPVIQIGGWMRNTFAIYELPNYISKYNYQKYALQGKGMDHYYLTYNQFIEYYSKLQQMWEQMMMMQNQNSASANNLQIEKRVTCAPLTPAHISPWIIGAQNAMLDNLTDSYLSVKMLHHLNNHHYDNLLSRSVVFLNLIDCSAVNTILECIVRNTPILVNKLPAVVEYLGEDYPLYYRTLEEAAKLLICDEAIESAHYYLAQMNKSDLAISHFMKNLTTIIQETQV